MMWHVRIAPSWQLRVTADALEDNPALTAISDTIGSLSSAQASNDVSHKDLLSSQLRSNHRASSRSSATQSRASRPRRSRRTTS